MWFSGNRGAEKLWAIQLDLAKRFIDLCEKESIQYYASGGTLLGAIRHQGYIPWDDDVDFVLPRKNYNKLCAIAAEAFREPYFFQTTESDFGYDRGFAKLSYSKSTAIPYGDLDSGLPYNQGIFIDIFPPLDNLPDDEKERQAWGGRSCSG